MSYTLHFPKLLQGTIQLPASKSISARVLVLAKLAGDGCLRNLSDCNDTRALRQALDQRPYTIDIGAAGTAMRFATAYFATQIGEEHILTGSQRMQQRPIGLLVDALRHLGADIEYLGTTGFPPLLIKGKKLQGGCISIPAHVSSQYISALLMIGPMLENGLELQLEGDVASKPYIEMTIGLMQQFGAKVAWNGQQKITVQPTLYRPIKEFIVEPDWSAASYWYEMMALSRHPNAHITLVGLTPQSLQGDQRVCQLFSELGVETIFNEIGATLLYQPTNHQDAAWEIDFSDCPDLAQTFVVTCALLGKKFRFSGLSSLRIKETDRIQALQNEFKKLGITIQTYTNEGGEEGLEGPSVKSENTPNTTISIATYDDHRMAMAFAPAAIFVDHLQILHPEVVEKSYPTFWSDLQKIGCHMNIS